MNDGRQRPWNACEKSPWQLHGHGRGPLPLSCRAFDADVCTGKPKILAAQLTSSDGMSHPTSWGVAHVCRFSIACHCDGQQSRAVTPESAAWREQFGPPHVKQRASQQCRHTESALPIEHKVVGHGGVESII
eukprot:6189373-Pleurochrysis_carterae.AAC.2